MFAILNWYGDPDSALLVTDEDGKTCLFKTEGEARGFAEGELNGSWCIADLDNGSIY